MRESLRLALIMAVFVAIAAMVSTNSASPRPVLTVASGELQSHVVLDSAYVVHSSAVQPVAAASRSHRALAKGKQVRLVCPTTRAPGCRLSWIRYDVGWRVHPVYGYHSCHTGIDLRGKHGDKIHAAAAGRVIRTGVDRAYGRYTLIQVNPVIRNLYAHQSRTQVHVGQRVKQHQVIGRVGATGFATGPHLHFEVHVNRHPYDPDGWLGAKSKEPVSCYPGTKY